MYEWYDSLILQPIIDIQLYAQNPTYSQLSESNQQSQRSESFTEGLNYWLVEYCFSNFWDKKLTFPANSTLMLLIRTDITHGFTSDECGFSQAEIFSREIRFSGVKSPENKKWINWQIKILTQIKYTSA